MAPTPQEAILESKKEQQARIHRPLSGNEVVISGMSGIFPKSGNVLEFMNNLYGKVDMVTSEDPRWVFNHPEVPEYLGKIEGMGKFDAQFFRVHFKQACTMEPMSRKLLEHAYSAIYDSGINPLQLRGMKVGVFIGSTFSESEKIVIYENIQRNGFGITGCNKAMYANRISYWIDGKGPSYAIDQACSSSMACLEHAYRSISDGQCDAAIVGGCNLCMHPCVSLNLKRAGFLCLDGKTKCFDKRGDGYVRSDAISVVFLQRARDAKRIYSEVYHAKGNYSLRDDAEFMPHRDINDIKNFLEEFYSEIDVSPKDVEYVEAYGAAIAEADANELEAIGQVFGKDKAVAVGSVKSNMGNSEPASGVCAVTKVCLAYEKGEIPANLHYEEPQKNLPSVHAGQVEIPVEHKPFSRGFAALNSFSYSGANVHVLLKGHHKEKDLERYKSSIPHIVLLSGRQESCVQKILDELKEYPIDPEAIGLLHNIHENDIPGHMCRGYTILATDDENKTVSLAQNHDYCPGIKRPLWFMYSGMGSQWASMGAELMRIPIFAATIERCRRALEPKGIDLLKILIEPDKKIFDNILNSFIGIAAVQMGITDILKAMGIEPDHIIGHSVGELGCAYADGCFTAEEMILSAYSRGLVSLQTPFIVGSMAAVGMSYKAILPLCPPEIEVACHNSAESCTISGPADVMKTFVGELTDRGVFAKEVPCSNIAYHSRYIADAGPGLLKYLSDVIKEPKPRSSKWMSTSVPQEKWTEPIAQLSSAEYHTNNLLNPVLFEETSKLIPSNAIVIEIAPHGLLQAIVKRSLPECTHVPLTRRGHADPVKFFLEGIGKLYEAGLNPQVSALYPTIQFPVSTGTPLLSHLVEWEHSENWPQAQYNRKDRVTAAARNFIMSIHDDDFKYMEGNVRNGENIFPETAMLILIWETFAMQKGAYYKDMSVVFSDVTFHDEIIIPTVETLTLGIMINKGNNRFEVNYDDTVLASGFIEELDKNETKPSHETNIHDELEEITLNSDDFYKIMFHKGYSYSGAFKSIQSMNLKNNEAKLNWTDEWVPFIDSLIQMNCFAKDHAGLSVPKLLKRLIIDVEEHKTKDLIEDANKLYMARLSKIHNSIVSGGVYMRGLEFENRVMEESQKLSIANRDFVPHFVTDEFDIKTVLDVYFQIVSDNGTSDSINVVEFTNNTTGYFTQATKIVADRNTSANFNVQVFERAIADQILNNSSLTSKANVVIVNELLGNKKLMKDLYAVLPKETFVMSWERNDTKIKLEDSLFDVVSAMNTGKHYAVLMKKATIPNNSVFVPVTSADKFSWVSTVEVELKKGKRVILVSERQPYCGLLGYVKSLGRRNSNISLMLIDDAQAPKFKPDEPVYTQQLNKNLTINVLKMGQWGGYYILPTKSSVQVRNISLTCSNYGDLDSLKWVEAPPAEPIPSLVQVCYAGPCIKDIQKITGKTINNKLNGFGVDFSGINQNGERVMGLVQDGAIGSTVQADPNLLWPVPDHWSLEEAATVPLPYLHAYYLLTVRCAVAQGVRVFVSGGAGALGQAVIAVCLALKCNVYTAVSDIHQKRFLARLFPDLDPNNIGYSGDSSFVSMVVNRTNNKRCHIVINCASGAQREDTMKLCGHSGILLDVTEKDMIENKDFGMFFVFQEQMYLSCKLDSIFMPQNAHEKKTLQLAIAEGISKGIVRPLTWVVYAPADAVRAFRLLASNRHRGRALIRMQDPKTGGHGLEVTPRITYSSKASYVVICDDSEAGVELADRLVRNGVRKMIINALNKSVSRYIQYKMSSWHNNGVTLKLLSQNLGSEAGCAKLLRTAAELGEVQGIYMTHLAQAEGINDKRLFEKYSMGSLLTANLDLVSRKMCNELKYFVVLMSSARSPAAAYENTVLRRVCRARTDVGFPALCLQISSLNQIDEQQSSSNGKLERYPLSAAFSVLDVSLKLSYHDVEAFQLRKPASNVLQMIAKVIGFKSTDDISKNMIIDELILNEEILEEIKTITKKHTSCVVPMQKLRNMTVAQLEELSLTSVKRTKFDSGLEAFFTYIDEDECLATEPVIAMPTKLSNGTENEEELDTKATYLMLIPGFEGHHQIFMPVCERLKAQAMTFQLGPDLPHDSITSIAESILTFIKKRFELNSNFYLLGYSFGVNVALELAALLEKDGHVGTVFCLDSSPDALRVQLDAYLGPLSETRLQDAIVTHLYKLMTGETSAQLEDDLAKADHWPEKVEACVNRIRGLVHYSHQYKRSLLQAAYQRISLSRSYQPTFKLNSEIVLMKGVAHPDGKPLPEDYNLSKYSKKPVQVFNLDADHALAPNDRRVSNIVNRLFEPAVLEQFKTKNLCETYLADPVKIL